MFIREVKINSLNINTKRIIYNVKKKKKSFIGSTSDFDTILEMRDRKNKRIEAKWKRE